MTKDYSDYTYDGKYIDVNNIDPKNAVCNLSHLRNLLNPDHLWSSAIQK